jgi:hypothetical protein
LPRTERDVEHSQRSRNSMISRSPSSLPRNTVRHTLCRGRNSHQPVLTFRQRAGEGGEAPCHPDRWQWHPQLWPPQASLPNILARSWQRCGSEESAHQICRIPGSPLRNARANLTALLRGHTRRTLGQKRRKAAATLSGPLCTLAYLYHCDSNCC